MFGIGFPELVVILIITLLVVGPERLPELGRQVGKAVRDMRRVYANLRSELGPEFDEIEQGIRDLRGLDPRQQIRTYGRDLLSDLSKDAPEIQQLAQQRNVSIEQAGRSLLNDSLLDKPLAETRTTTADDQSASAAVAPSDPPAQANTTPPTASTEQPTVAARDTHVIESNGHFE